MKQNFGTKPISLCSEVDTKQFPREDLGPIIDASLSSLETQTGRRPVQSSLDSGYQSSTAHDVGVYIHLAAENWPHLS